MKLIKFLIIFFFVIVTNLGALENKIILKVDNDIITTLDILEEINHLKFFNKKAQQLNDNEIYEIAMNSILKSRIKKETIIKEIGEVKLNDNSYLNTLIKNQYENLGFKNLKEFKKELENKNINYKNYEQNLKIDILWNQIIYSLFFDKVVIDKEELKKQIKNQDNFITSFDLSEIVFQAESNNELEKTYNLIKKEINERGFENAVIKYSSSETASDGGNLGWINSNQINKQILESINKISNDAITEPIRIPSGFLILKKNDVKLVEKNLNEEEELKKLVNYQTDIQLKNYSNIYFNKVKKDISINAP